MLGGIYFLMPEIRSAKRTEVGLVIFSRVVKTDFNSKRAIRSWRFISQITGAACLVAAASAAVAFQAGPAAAQVSATDAPAYSLTLTVTSLADSGAGSLRAAIAAADATTPGESTLIIFAVPGTIDLASPLPAIVQEVAVDALTAPTHVSNGPPVVAIDCNGHPGVVFGAGSGGSQLLGVAVDHASSDGVTLDAGPVTLDGDYIGLDLAGAAAGNGGNGVYVSPASGDNFIGVNGSGASGVVANVISGNGGNGIDLVGSALDTVVANRIGTNPAGTAAIPNGANGIMVTRASQSNDIGVPAFVDTATGQANNPTGSKGTVPPVFVVPPLGNLISGNRGNGVLIEAGSTGTVLSGNFIGTTASGDGPLGNGDNGVWMYNAPGNALIGCQFVNNPFAYYNVVSGNGLNGLRVTSSDNVVVQGNFFGVGADNAAIVKNRLDGILVDGSSADTLVGGVIPLGNVSAGNGRNGIQVAGTASGFVTFNTFGGLLAFKGAAPNGHDGLLITSAGNNNVVRTNVFSGNAGNGIELAGNTAGVVVVPNIAGLSTKGDAALPNGGDGLLIDGSAHGNIIGGPLVSVIPQNTFSGNKGYGVVLGGWAWDNHVTLSFIGTQILGVHPLANKRGGVLITGHAFSNYIGEPGVRPANLISGNGGPGVTLTSGTFDNFVIENYLGLDRLGRYLRNSGPPVINRGYLNTLMGNLSRPVRH